MDNKINYSKEDIEIYKMLLDKIINDGESYGVAQIANTDWNNNTLNIKRYTIRIWKKDDNQGTDEIDY